MAMARLHKHDPDCTNLKHVNVNDNVCQSSRKKKQKLNHAHLSDSRGSYQSGTNIPLLPRTQLVSITSDDIVECDNFPTRNVLPAAQLFYNNIQTRELPPTPPQGVSLDDLRCSLSKSSSCASCGCSGHSVREEKHFNKRHYLTCIAAVSLLFSVVSCSIAIHGFVFKKTPSWETMTIKEGVYETCVPCVQLLDNDVLSAGLQNQLTKKMRDGKLICCANTGGQMSALVQLIMKQKTVNVVTSPAQSGLKFTPVSAHKHLQPWISYDTEELKFPDRHYHLKLRAANDGASWDHARHVTATNNSLQILFSGWYLVYSSVYFRPRTNKMCGQLRHQTWGHFVSRKSRTKSSTSGILLQSAHTCCDSCRDDHHTSYTAGVFLLEAGDDVYVEVSGSGLVMFDEETSYLGLAMLGSWSSARSQ
ncbi:unnamed protein product [Candidula unifasciata]|uniref:THD domain-containing protein n=1 Tax=Candidula unifasciata TaxID=100452 RepID=A0A8S4A8G1_9EUPU|nr:unnamed protein product [Candidula unifasciata]